MAYLSLWQREEQFLLSHWLQLLVEFFFQYDQLLFQDSDLSPVYKYKNTIQDHCYSFVQTYAEYFIISPVISPCLEKKKENSET